MSGNTPIVADREERFASSPAFHPRFYMEKDEANSPQIMPDITQPLTFTRQRLKTEMDIKCKGMAQSPAKKQNTDINLC